jgi:hypothetical protein
MLATKNRRVPDPFFSTLIPDKQKPIDDRYAYGPRLEWIILNDTQRALRFETFYLHADDGDNYTARLSFRYRFSPTVTGISEVRNTKTRGDKESSVINSATYDGTDLQRLGTRGVATNEVRETRRANGSGNSQSNSGTSIIDNLEVSHTNDYARGSGFVRDNRSSQADSTFLGVQGEGAFIVSDNGEVSVSRPIQDGAALVANLESETSKARFEVRLNDQLIGTLQAGERRIFGITPYRTYRVSIRPAENSEMLSYDNSGEEFTVFPGNIVSRTWKVNRVVVVIGRVIDSTGAPIKLKKIKGTRDFVATDENGNFQSDLAGDEKLFIDLKEGGCSIPTPDIDNFKDYLLDVGDVVCN